MLLPLLREEQALLADYGRDHPQVLAVRERIRVVRDYLATHPAPPVRRVDQAVAPAGWVDGPGARTGPASLAPSPGAAPGKLLALTPLPRAGAEVAQPAPAVPPSAPVARPAPAAPATVQEHRALAEPRSEGPSFATSFVQVIGGLAAFVLLLVAGLVALCFGLRRFGGRMGPLIQVHLVNTQAGSGPLGSAQPTSSGGEERRPYELRAPIEADRPAAPPSPIASPTPPSTEQPSDAPAWLPDLPGPVARAEDQPVESTAQSFDLGPSYEESKQQEEQMLKQQDEAILRQVFEENLLLRAEIDKLDVVAIATQDVARADGLDVASTDEKLDVAAPEKPLDVAPEKVDVAA